MELAENFRRFLRENGMSGRKLAEMAGLHYNTIYNVIRCKFEPSRETMVRFRQVSDRIREAQRKVFGRPVRKSKENPRVLAGKVKKCLKKH